MRYAVWNNKGGVGKTFLTFAIATEVATRLKKLNDPRQVVVIDMCPQANVSEILLGGNSKGAKTLSEDFIKEGNGPTIAGYFAKRIEGSPYSRAGIETDYVREVHKHNRVIPDNLHLIAGDPAIELQIPTINMLAGGEIPEGAWIKVHSWVLDLIEGSKLHFSSGEPLFFIDCNPSFSIYTELALVAANRLIIPCSPDGSSARAIINVARLVYGHKLKTAHATLGFSKKLEQAEKQPPKIHLFVSNRKTIYADAPAKSYQAMVDQVQESIRDLHQSQVNMFSESNMEKLWFSSMPDAHSVGVLMSSKGLPLNQIKPKTYDIGGSNIQINQDQITRYQEAMDTIVERLGVLPVPPTPTTPAPEPKKNKQPEPEKNKQGIFNRIANKFS